MISASGCLAPPNAPLLLALFARIAIILALLSIPLGVQAQGVLRDDFEGPDLALKPAGGDGRHRVELHQRVDTGPHSGQRCEQLRITGGGSTAIYYSYPLQPARVISELSMGLWLRSDRPGLQVVARVVLPNSPHPTTGEPLTTLIRGADYRQVGMWQLLKVDNLPRAVELQVRVLRSQFGPQVDPREAYVDLLLVNVYGGAGTTNVWIDDLEMTGAVPLSAVATREPVREPAAPGSPTLAAPSNRLPAAMAQSVMPSVELKNRLLVGDKPFFPRIIQFRGEPLARLQQLGFNCVRLGQRATPELLSDAARLQLWLIAPPPPMETLRRGAAPPNAPPQSSAIGAEYDPVLAWDLGSGLTNRQFEVTRQWAAAVQAADGRGRPILCGAADDLQNYTRPPFKVFLSEREPLGTTLELNRYASWLTERSQFARAGAPLWATIPTQASPELLEQMRLVARLAVPPPVWQEAQVRTLIHQALASRARGIYFTSESRLDAEDPITRGRAVMLELLNLELQLIERWPADGNFSALADTSDPQTTGAVLETEHSRLLLPIYQPPGGQFVTGTQGAALISVTVAGVPEGDDAYELSLTGLRPLRSTRRAGGTQVVLVDKSRDSLVVFTRDPYVLRNLKESLDKFHRRALHLTRELVTLQLAEVDATAGRLGTVGQGINLAKEVRTTVENDLKQCAALAPTDISRAYDEARHALQALRQLERVYWEQATRGAAPLSDPLSASFGTLVVRDALLRQLASLPRSPNRLAEGACENLAAMMAAGWKHYQHQQPAIQTGVDLTPRAAHTGAAGLLLRAMPADDKVRPSAVETPPVWVSTAPLVVEAGDLVQIQAWVRIDVPIVASADGLVVLDSHSGEPLAARLHKTAGWQQLTLYRAATRPGPLVVTFALAGLGEAAIDDVTMQIVERGPAVPQQASR